MAKATFIRDMRVDPPASWKWVLARLVDRSRGIAPRRGEGVCRRVHHLRSRRAGGGLHGLAVRTNDFPPRSRHAPHLMDDSDGTARRGVDDDGALTRRLRGNRAGDDATE